MGALGRLQADASSGRGSSGSPLSILAQGSSSKETQEHAVGALLHLASQDVASRNAVVQRLVTVLGLRSATAQMKAAEALAVLAARSDENRKAITAADAISPLVRILGDGRRVSATLTRLDCGHAIAQRGHRGLAAQRRHLSAREPLRPQR